MPEGREADDSFLLKQAQSGQTEAFGALYQRYAPTVFRFLSAHLSNSLDAEDLTGDVFLRVWRSLPSYEQHGVPFLAYLFRVARNAMIDLYRRSAHREIQFSAAEEPISTLQDAPPDIALTNLENEELRRQLHALREDYRTVLALRFLNGFSPEETALIMQRTEGAVRVLQHRALVALRTKLGNW